MGFPRAGSNPAHSVVECLLNLTSKIICVGLLYLISSEVGFKHQGLISSDYCEREGQGYHLSSIGILDFERHLINENFLRVGYKREVWAPDVT